MRKIIIDAHKEEEEHEAFSELGKQEINKFN